MSWPLRRANEVEKPIAHKLEQHSPKGRPMKRLPYSRSTPIHAIAAALLMASATQAQTTLRWKFEQGAPVNYVLEQKSIVTARFMGQEIKSESGQTMDMAWTSTKVAEDGSFELGVAITRVRAVMNGPAGLVEYDSGSNEQPEGEVGVALAESFGGMVDQAFTMTMTPLGEVTEFTLPKKLEESLGQAAAGAGAGLSAESIKQLVTAAAWEFPESAIRADSRWTDKTSAMTSMGEFIVNTEFVYDGSEKRADRTVEKITLKPQMEFASQENTPVKVTITDQEAGGTLYFDNAAGRLVESDSNLRWTMVAEVNGNAMEQEIDQKTTMKLTGGNGSR